MLPSKPAERETVNVWRVMTSANLSIQGGYGYPSTGPTALQSSSPMQGGYGYPSTGPHALQSSSPMQGSCPYPTVPAFDPHNSQVLGYGAYPPGSIVPNSNNSHPPIGWNYASPQAIHPHSNQMQVGWNSQVAPTYGPPNGQVQPNYGREIGFQPSSANGYYDPPMANSHQYGQATNSNNVQPQQSSTANVMQIGQKLIQSRGGKGNSKSRILGWLMKKFFAK